MGSTAARALVCAAVVAGGCELEQRSAAPLGADHDPDRLDRADAGVPAPDGGQVPAPDAGGGGGLPEWWLPSCEPQTAPPLDPLPPCPRRHYVAVVIDDRPTIPGQRSEGVAVNESGQVAGDWNPGSDLEDWTAWKYASGVRRDIIPFPIDYSFSRGINELGTTVGRVKPAAITQAFVESGGDIQILADEASAEGINDRGDVTGRRTTSDGTILAWVHLPAENITLDLGTLGGDHAIAQAINNHRVVVGGSGYAPGGFDAHAFAQICNQMVDLGTLGGSASFATDINDRGDIVGWSHDASGVRVPFLYRDGQMTPLPPGLGAEPSINDRGEVVGGSLIYSDGVVYDIRHLLAADDCWRTIAINGINDHGDMVGWGWRCDDEPRFMAIAITATPERYR